jgi:hypothetical protein
MIKVSGYYFGHFIITDDGKKWYYADTKEVITPPRCDRACPKCHLFKTSEGHDPCISNIPGVIHACCGHGGEAYIMEENREITRFESFNVLKEFMLSKFNYTVKE